MGEGDTNGGGGYKGPINHTRKLQNAAVFENKQQTYKTIRSFISLLETSIACQNYLLSIFLKHLRKNKKIIKILTNWQAALQMTFTLYDSI